MAGQNDVGCGQAQDLTRDTVAHVRKALTELPVDFREVIVLRELEGFSYKEIAMVINAPIGTVMSRLARARKQLQDYLARKGETKK